MEKGFTSVWSGLEVHSRKPAEVTPLIFLSFVLLTTTTLLPCNGQDISGQYLTVSSVIEYRHLWAVPATCKDLRNFIS